MSASRISSFILLSILFCPAAWSEAPDETLNTLLDSGSLSEQRAAFEKIVSSPKEYVPLVRDRFSAVLKGQPEPIGRALDRLFYLAAFLKDKSLAAPMEAIWRDPSLLPNYCLYSCPIVFALTVYATSDQWTPPENMTKSCDRHYDLYPEIRIASEISLEPTPMEHRARGPGIDRYLEEVAEKSEMELIEQAGPMTQGYMKRFAAACQLEYSVSSSKNLKDLYWLAFQEVSDAAVEFRGAVYSAIYRAERARRMGR